MATFQQGHALSIGVGTYQDPAWNAPITVADATEFAEALKDPAGGGYPAAQVELLHDAQATREGVKAALAGLAKRAKEGDTTVVYFCGHGVLGDDGLYHFTTHDTAFTPGKKAKAGTGLSAPEILELLRKVNAQKLLFLINACFSGHLGPTLGPSEALGAPLSATLSAEVLGTGEGRVLITASRPSQFSFYRKQDRHTYFGQALIDGLRGQGVRDSGGYVGLYELYQHLYARVKTMTDDAQEPVLNIVRGVGPFPVALYPGGSPGGLGAPPLMQQPPSGTAAEVFEPRVVQAIGLRAQAINVQAGRDVRIDQSRKVIDFGSGNIMGNVNIGKVAGRDVINVTTTRAGAAEAGPQDSLPLIERLRDDVSRLSDVPSDRRQDTDDELRKAWEAAQRDNRPRLWEKLESAYKLLLTAVGKSPTASSVAEAIATLLQRAISMGE
jgi:hypothetical protein